MSSKSLTARSLSCLSLIWIVVGNVAISETRQLHDSELENLLEIAEGGLDSLKVLHVDASVALVDGREIAMASVVYDMEQHRTTGLNCFAPTVLYRAAGEESDIGQWESAGHYHFRFFFSPCNSIDPGNFIELAHPMSIRTLKAVSSHTTGILNEANHHLSAQSQLGVSERNFELRAIDASQNDENGANWMLIFRDASRQELRVRATFNQNFTSFQVLSAVLE